MQKDTIIYVTDQRQKYLADMLGGEQTDCRNSGGIDYERVGNIVFPTPFSKLKLINSDIEKLKHNIIINNIAVWVGFLSRARTLRFPGAARSLKDGLLTMRRSRGAISAKARLAGKACGPSTTWRRMTRRHCRPCWIMPVVSCAGRR